ncbi:MAG TPA: autotransporter domain-containing protein [Microvirga sp.]|jgi:outer membrane autotransporter protein
MGHKRTQRRATHKRQAIAVFSTLALSQPAIAQQAIWLGTADYELDKAANWSTGAVPRSGVAIFDDSFLRLPELDENDSPTTFGTMRFVGQRPYRIYLAEHLTLSGTGIETAPGSPAPYFITYDRFGKLIFSGSSSAGNATIEHDSLQPLEFRGNSSGGTARLILNGPIVGLDISQATKTTIDVGSIEGSAAITLGSKTLRVGGNNASTVYSGVIFDNFLSLGGTATGGQLVKEGSGTLILTQDQRYTGGTAVSGGTLQIGDGGATGNLLGPVFTRANFAINRSGDFTFANVIFGDGGITKLGTGTTTLTGSNLYGGPTQIASGTLVAQGGNAIGFGSAVTISPGATLRVRASEGIGSLSGGGSVQIDAGASLGVGELRGTGDYAGQISGAGRLIVANGTQSLSGISTYSGGTRIAFGTLLARNGLALGFGAIELGQNGRLSYASGISLPNGIAINGTGSSLHVEDGIALQSGAISGSEVVTKTGLGTLALVGSHSLEGGVRINQGRIDVNGSLPSAVTVNNGGTVGGDGTIGALTATGGSRIAPGTALGTLTVAGNVTINTGATYAVDVKANGEADRLHATGAIFLNGGIVSVQAIPGQYQPFTRYKILSSDDGVTGRFSAAVTNLAFLYPNLQFTPFDVTLELEYASGALAAAALTNRQAEVATAVEALGINHPVFASVVSQSRADVNTAFDALSGEVNAALGSVVVNDVALTATSVLNRIRPTLIVPSRAQGGPLTHQRGPVASERHQPSLSPGQAGLPWTPVSIWGQAIGSRGSVDATLETAGLTRRTGGLIVGADLGFGGRWRAGFAGSWARSSFDVAQRQSSGETDTYGATIYGSAELGALGFRGGLSYAQHEIDTNRTVSFPGYSGRVAASYSGRSVQAFGEVGYRVSLAPLVIEPYAGLAHVGTRLGSFQETGDAAALTGAGMRRDLTSSILGLRLAAPLGALTAKAGVSWRHVMGDKTPQTLSAFSFNPALPFKVVGSPIASNTVGVEAGLEWAVTPHVQIGVSYDGQFASSAREHRASADLRISF